MKQNKGFTLIELLAVIVILAVISLIITPVITGIIKSAQKQIFKSGAYSYISAAKNKCATDKLKGLTGSFTYEKIDGVVNSSDTLDGYLKGKEADKTQISTQIDCDSSIAIYSDSLKLCAYKEH